ncbi:DUF4376 domain-containing protein, partial [Gulbenkiania mobilis]|uniref:DUF4376 domain-containing protein n=1 Tax=Gulbenkiania mobilis TaxID=397457 RepID=UPI00128F2243
MWLLDGKTIFDGGFTAGEVTYPPGWIALASDEERAAVGISYRPDPPSPTHVWDGDAWVLDAAGEAQLVATRRTELLAAINAERDRREEAGFSYRGKLLDSTSRSVQRITAAALAAQAAVATGTPFSLEWTCADNSTLTLDAAGVIGMPV